MENEIWKAIPKFKNYQISNTGIVKSTKKKKEIILKAQTTSWGYIRVYLYRDGKRYQFPVHRLVLTTFIGKSKLHCNHKDGIKSNNNLENLEYCTMSENTVHAFKTGLMVGLQGIRHPLSKLTENQVRRIKFIFKNYKPEKGYWRKVADSLGIDRHTIYYINNNTTWVHIN